MSQDPEVEPEAEQPARDVLLFTSLDDFVREFLCQVIRRRLDHASQTWCPRWWMHPEALSRLSALWRAFEHSFHNPELGLSEWWIYHADPHLAALMHPELGPFAACDPKRGHSDYPFEPMPAEPAPPELMAHEAFSFVRTTKGVDNS